MRIPTSANVPLGSSIGPRPASPDRRERARLRDLCDEVLASFRVARGRDPITDTDRADAREMLRRVAPLAGA
jgi:hypothetical protein